jgi:alkylhydroperoxidase/carboxymuconolactone decarboxylase family protein YurZ
MIGQARMWGVKPYMERALRLGCTEQQILETLETALPVRLPAVPAGRRHPDTTDDRLEAGRGAEGQEECKLRMKK